jgi:hypothetical protein
MVYFSSLVAASLAATLSVTGFPLSARQNSFSLQNGLDAQAQKYVEIFNIHRIRSNKSLVVSISRLSTPTPRAMTARTGVLVASSPNVLMASSP